jgi:endonuclease/exonuclease/phosphatase (EEP) superfamily protein YafD
MAAPTAASRKTGPVRASRGDWDTVRRVPRFQALLLAVGVVSLGAAAVFALLRLVPPADDATALVASFIPYGLVGALVAFVCLGLALLRARRRLVLAGLTLLSALLLGLQVAWQAPLFVPDGRTATSAGFTLLSLNTFKGEADPAEVVTAAAQADVVVLLEVTPTLAASLDGRGWRSRYPYRAGLNGSSVSNTVVFSRYPLTGSVQIGEGSFDEWLTTASLPDLGAVRLLGVHACNPYCGGNRWAQEHAVLQRVVRQNLDRPLLVAGDFNAVDDHGPMQQLRRLGMRSATDLVGAGWLPTYPANKVVPPLLPIDHVLLDTRLTATALHRVPIGGTDHLGLLATVAGAG